MNNDTQHEAVIDFIETALVAMSNLSLLIESEDLRKSIEYLFNLKNKIVLSEVAEPVIFNINAYRSDIVVEYLDDLEDLDQ